MAGKAEVKAGAAVHAAMRSMLLALVRPHLPQMGLALVLLTAQSVAILLQPWLAGELAAMAEAKEAKT